MRIVFMGTPDFAVTVLEKLTLSHDVIAVISQPDREKDRHGRLLRTPVANFAENNNLPLYQFDKVRLHCDELKKFDADVFVTAAYGQMLTQDVLDIPRLGTLNVHASLLPAYRGSSPIQSAILAGDGETGVTIMQTVLKMDAGDILAFDAVEIGDMNAGQLSDKLAKKGAELLVDTLELLRLNKAVPLRQDESKATTCKKISKEQAEIFWDKPCDEIYNVIRAFNPSPVAYSVHGGRRIKIYEAERVEYCGEPGRILFADKRNGLVVACGKGSLRIKKLQLPGKNILTDFEFLNGNKLTIGDKFGN